MEYCRSGFDCETLMIANCEFFWSSQSKESQSILEHITIIQVQGQPLQSLKLQFGLTSIKHNHYFPSKN